MPADDRDAKFERAFSQRLRAGSAQAGCPDAEMLAAYHERSLSLEEMAQWKQHIVGCAQCQETLSLVEVTEKEVAEEWEEQKVTVPEATGGHAGAQTNAARGEAGVPLEMATPAIKVFRKRPALIRWAIPLGAVAAGALIWIGIREQRAPRQPAASNVQVAENRPQGAVAPNMDYEGAPKTEPPVAKEREQVAPNERDARPLRVPAEKESNDARLVSPAIGDALRKDESATKKQGVPEPSGIAGGNLKAAAPPPPVPPPALVTPKPTPPVVTTETVEVTAAAPSVETAKNPVDLPTAGGGSGGALDQKHIAAMNRTKSAPQPQAAPQQSSADVNTNALMLSQGVSRSMSQASATASGVIVTPDHKVWWKIGANGSVELTTDAGKNWKTLETGSTSQLTAGSAPSGKVCWVAGKGGTLLLTTDRGGRWKTLTTPIAGDLGGVHAGDAKHATIWDTANRLSFETSDGGATWKQVANE